MPKSAWFSEAAQCLALHFRGSKPLCLVLIFSGSCPQQTLHRNIPGSTPCSFGSTPQSIHAHIYYFRLVKCHVANLSPNVIYKAQRTPASSQFFSTGMRPSCHRAQSEMNCRGCRHWLVVVWHESASRSRGHDNHLTSFWKFCLHLQQFMPLKCPPCLQRSSPTWGQGSTHGVVGPGLLTERFYKNTG